MRSTVHPIEVESFEILRSRVDLSHLPPLSRAVVERVVHSSADLDYVDDLVVDEASLTRGWRALRAGAPVVADVQMVAAGITTLDAVCKVRTAKAGAAEKGAGFIDFGRQPPAATIGSDGV